MSRLPILGTICSVLLILSLFAVISCSKESRVETMPVKEPKEEVAVKAEAHAVPMAFAKELVRCAPSSKSDDTLARDKAAVLLRDSLLLKNSASEMILWGGRPADGSYKPDDYTLTEFSWFVWSNMYLSLFSFSGEHKIIEKDGLAILSAQCEFRGELEPGAYPYPFWHAPKKWASYDIAKAIDFVFKDDKLIAIFRTNVPDAKARKEHKWDGQWSWTDAKGEQPHNALYDYMLAKENPHRVELDKAYREFALEARKHNCMSCHAPDNPSKMSKLSLLNYPNQALTFRHEVVSELDSNAMPPKTKEKATSGIDDPEQRKALLKLAKTFSDVGDKAMKFEDERMNKK